MIEVDLPPGVEITGYERHQEGHGFEVRWPLPERCRCQRCGHEDRAHIEYKTSPQAVRDLDVWGQPSFWIYQAPFHRCARCDYRQHLIPPFKGQMPPPTYQVAATTWLSLTSVGRRTWNDRPVGRDGVILTETSLLLERECHE